jgi:regulation of enolase protein 1 (concanavalin A-like superfamily)
MKTRLVILMLLLANGAMAQVDSLGLFEHHQDIGNPKIKGSATYDKVTHTYTLTGAGYNIWFNRDEFQYLFKKIKGDFIATANFEFIGDKGNNHRKIGWMIRESIDESAVHISAVEHGDGLTVLQWRSVKGEDMKDPEGEIFYPDKNFEVIQLQRIGKTLTMRIGHIGEPLKTLGSHTLPAMPDEALVGLFICSHDPAVIEKARIWDVHIEQPGSKK